MRPLTILVVAAEASGDDRGAALIRALRARLGDEVRFVGVGGVRMAAEGVQSPFDISELSVLGLLEGLMAYPRVVSRVRDVAALAAAERPDAAVLIDSWGFTLRVARALRTLDPSMRLIKYVGPQIWASRPGRAATLAGAVDHLLTIHAFDAPMFEAAGLPTTFVGNSALSVDFSGADPVGLLRRLGLDSAVPVLLVLPGSRPSEVSRLAGPFGDAVSSLAARYPNLNILVPAAPTVAAAVRDAVEDWPRTFVLEGEADKLSAMKAATLALACSGTVTTELALAGVPMVVAYRVGKVTYALLKRLVRTPYITLFNIAAGRPIAPELIQDACDGDALAQALAVRIEDAEMRHRQVAAQFAALDLMGRGGPDPSTAAAEAIMAVLKR